jgi:hypothetical protein
MKKINYGQITDTNYTGLEETEFLTPKDYISSRAVNRVANNLQSNIEENYNILQSAIKTIYGNKSGIVPDVYEEFDVRNIKVDQIMLNRSWWLKIPTGIAFLRTIEEGYDPTSPLNTPTFPSAESITRNQDNNAGKDTGNPFHFRNINIRSNFYVENDKQGLGWDDTLRESNFQNDFWHSYSIVNKPNIELFERQLAKLINLDISDNENDIKVKVKFVRATVDDGPLGVPGQILDTDPNNDDDPSAKYEAHYNLSITENRNNQNNKWYFPFEPVNTNFILTNIKDGANPEFNVNISLRKQNSILEAFTIKIIDKETIDQIAMDTCSIINGNSSYLTAYSDDVNNIKIEFKENDPKYDEYTLFIQGSAGSSWFFDGNFSKNNSTTPSPNPLIGYNIPVTNKCVQQGYYENIFDLINNFLISFRGSLTTTQKIGDLLNLVPIIPLSNIGNNDKRIVYYNKDLIDYKGTETFRILDKSKRFGITSYNYNNNPSLSNGGEPPEGTIPLFVLTFKKDDNGVITLDSAKPYFELYDRRSIHTKHIFTNLIRSDTRTELVNWLHYKDREDNPFREIRIINGDKLLSGDLNKKLEMNFISPVIQLVDEDVTIEDVTPISHITNGGQNYIRIQKDTNGQTGDGSSLSVDLLHDNAIDVIANKNDAKINIKVTKDRTTERINTTGRLYIESRMEDQIEIKSLATGTNPNTGGSIVESNNDWAPENYNNIYFSNNGINKVTKIRITPEGDIILQNRKSGNIDKYSIYDTDASITHNSYSGTTTGNSLNGFLNPKNLSLKIESSDDGTQKNIITFGHIKNVNTSEALANFNIPLFNLSKNSYDIGGKFPITDTINTQTSPDSLNKQLPNTNNILSIHTNRYRNISVRNAWFDIINLDGGVNRRGENAKSNFLDENAPSISLNLNDSNINNVRAIYFNYVDNESVREYNHQSLNFHIGGSVSSKVNTLWSYNGGFGISTHRSMSITPYYDVNYKLFTDPDNQLNETKSLLRLDKFGTLKLKRGLRVVGYNEDDVSNETTQVVYLQSSLWNDGREDHQGSVVTRGGITSFDTNDNYSTETDISKQYFIFANEPDADVPFTSVTALKENLSIDKQPPLSTQINDKVLNTFYTINDKYRFGGALTLRGGAWIDKRLTIFSPAKIEKYNYSSSKLTTKAANEANNDAALRILRGGAYVENNSRFNGIVWLTLNGDYSAGGDSSNTKLDDFDNDNTPYNKHYTNQYGVLRIMNGGAYIHKNLTIGPKFDGAASGNSIGSDSAGIYILNNTPAQNHTTSGGDNGVTGSIVSKGGFVSYLNYLTPSDTNDLENSANFWAVTNLGGGLSVPPIAGRKWKNLSWYSNGSGVFQKKLYVGFGIENNTNVTPYKNSSYNVQTNSSMIVNGPMTIFGTVFGFRSKNAIWNDYADFIEVKKDIIEIPGKVYVVDDSGKAFIAYKRAQKGVIGVCTDTYGYATGEDSKINQIPIGVSGFVLGIVDKIYLPGTELVSNKDGNLTKANWFEKLFKRETIVGTFYKKQDTDEWNGVKVNCRSWIKI